MTTSKSKKVKKSVNAIQPQAPKTFRERWARYSFAEKVMVIFSVLIVISMILALLPLSSF